MQSHFRAMGRYSGNPTSHHRTNTVTVILFTLNLSYDVSISFINYLRVTHSLTADNLSSIGHLPSLK